MLSAKDFPLDTDVRPTPPEIDPYDEEAYVPDGWEDRARRAAGENCALGRSWKACHMGDGGDGGRMNDAEGTRLRRRRDGDENEVYEGRRLWCRERILWNVCWFQPPSKKKLKNKKLHRR